MPNAYLPREMVHAWSEDIGEHANDNQSALTRLLREQRRLTKFIEENQANLEPQTGGVAVYLFGVVARMFDLAGGRLRSATWAQVREAEQRVQAVAVDLIPADDGFVDRVRAIEWRAQPHILDEALMALFARDTSDDEVSLDKTESMKVFFLLWVATEVLDVCWKPARSFAGESTYTYVHIEPDDDDKDDKDDKDDS